MPRNAAVRAAETEGPPRAARTRRSRPARLRASRPPEPTPFPDAFAYLDAWFDLLGPDRLADESPVALARIPSIEQRLGLVSFLHARTERSLAAGVELPFEAFVNARPLDLLDRLLLLALLRHALDPLADPGIPTIRLLRAVGADGVGRRQLVLSRLEEGGALRDLGAVQSIPDAAIGTRVYRLAPRLVGPLAAGAERPWLPPLPTDPIASLAALRQDVVSLGEAVFMTGSKAESIWNAPIPGLPGWDHTALRRERLAARLDAAARAPADLAGAELRRLGLEAGERLAWVYLLHDSDCEEFGVEARHVLRFVGPRPDPFAEAERLFGPGSRMARADVLRFDRPAAPILGRVIWISRAARDRVFPWPRGPFERRLRVGLDDEANAPRLGFGPGTPLPAELTINEAGTR